MKQHTVIWVILGILAVTLFSAAIAQADDDKLPKSKKLIQVQKKIKAVKKEIKLIKKGKHESIKKQAEECSALGKEVDEAEEEWKKAAKKLDEKTGKALLKKVKADPEKRISEYMETPEEMSKSDFFSCVSAAKKLVELQNKYEKMDEELDALMQKEIKSLEKKVARPQEEEAGLLIEYQEAVLLDTLSGCKKYKDKNAAFPVEELTKYVKDLQKTYKSDFGWDEDGVWEALEDAWENARPCIPKSERKKFGAKRTGKLAKAGETGASVSSGRAARGNGPLDIRKEADAMALRSGGSRESQEAVALGLKWIARHQYSNGGWNFNHTLAPQCKNKCGSPGLSVKAVNGATAMAILPFLGSGQTHKKGEHKETIYRGLNFLCGQMKLNPNVGGGSLHEQDGSMYSHGLATLCLTEAYGMTKDKRLEKPAQLAIDFIQGAQDSTGGGWRYQPRQAGDTSVLGWQMSALKSGTLVNLKTSPAVTEKAMRFLDSVQDKINATYGYQTPGNGPATTTIGLLCRMYGGWKHDNPALEEGVDKISEWGPSKVNVYYNYYATQVMYHFGGDSWEKWNNTMRDQLVKSQVRDKNSHQLGSWTPSENENAKKGGRLYETALSVLTLEVYYRYAPIYQKQNAKASPEKEEVEEDVDEEEEEEE